MDRESYGTHGGKFCSSYTAVAVLTRRRVHLCRYACSSVLTVECQYTTHTRTERGGDSFTPVALLQHSCHRPRALLCVRHVVQSSLAHHSVYFPIV